MVPRSRNTMTTQSGTFMVLCWVLVSGPIKALAAMSPVCVGMCVHLYMCVYMCLSMCVSMCLCLHVCITIFARYTSGPCGGRKESPQGHKGSVTPCVNVGPS